MKDPQPRAEIDIRGTLVGFLRRDIRQIDDRERQLVERLVESQQREAAADETVTRIIIETDYPDPDRLAYVASYRVEVNGEERRVQADPGECDRSGEPE